MRMQNKATLLITFFVLENIGIFQLLNELINIFKCYNFITNMVNVYKHIINAFRDPQ